MDYVKAGRMVLVCGLSALLCGCATGQGPGKQAKVNLPGNTGQALAGGNDYLYPPGGWSEPLIEDVEIPAQVVNGMFYPRHNEPVIITPGQWKTSGKVPLRAGSKSPQPRTMTKDEEEVDLTTLPVVAGQDREEGMYVQN